MDGTPQRKEVYGEKKKEKNKKNQSVAWYACEDALGNERYAYVRLSGWKTRRSVC